MKERGEIEKEKEKKCIRKKKEEIEGKKLANLAFFSSFFSILLCCPEREGENEQNIKIGNKRKEEEKERKE